MKQTYKIPELMELLHIESRSTFWRKRQSGEIPAPDLASGHPIWFRASLERSIPNLPTNP